MAIHISPFGNGPLYLPNLAPAAGYTLYVYLAGTTTKATVYADIAGTPQANPIVLDASGWPENAIYLDDVNNYRFVYAHPLDQDPPLTQITPAIDNVAIVAPPVQTIASEWINGTTPTFISGTQFSVAGNQSGIYHAGRRIRATISGEFSYGTITAVSVGANTTVTVRNDTSPMTSGLSAVSYGFLSAQNSAWPGGRSNGIDTILAGQLVMDLSKEFSLLPAGSIIAYAGISYPPAGFYLTDGGFYSRSTHPKLAAALDYTGNPSLIQVPTIANLQANIRYIIRSH